MLLFQLVAISLPSLFLLLCGLLATWLALGRTNIFIRMPVFLLGTLLLGMVPCLAAVSRTDSPVILYLYGLTFLGASLVRIPVAARVFSFTMGALSLLPLTWLVESNTFDTNWIVRVSVATLAASVMISSIRCFGYRLVNLTDGVSNLEIEAGTGRGLDEWIRELDAANCQSRTYAEIMAMLRPYGFSFDWQKTLTVAYESALGRRVVGETGDGRSVVVDRQQRDVLEWLTLPRQQQFTVWQLMVVTFCAACFLGFARSFTWSRPTLVDLMYGVPPTFGVAAIAIAAVVTCLAIRSLRGKLLWFALASVATALIVQQTGGYRSIGALVGFVAFGAMLAYAAMFAAAMFQVRSRGYRLVRVQARS